jgi:hypothetical protein
VDAHLRRTVQSWVVYGSLYTIVLILMFGRLLAYLPIQAAERTRQRKADDEGFLQMVKRTSRHARAGSTDFGDALWLMIVVNGPSLRVRPCTKQISWEPTSPAPSVRLKI